MVAKPQIKVPHPAGRGDRLSAIPHAAVESNERTRRSIFSAQTRSTERRWRSSATYSSRRKWPNGRKQPSRTASKANFSERVGWVERSETHQKGDFTTRQRGGERASSCLTVSFVNLMGFAPFQPIHQDIA